jgi:hypothetical protein
MNRLTTDVLVVGGGVGGTAAAIQSARRGVQTLLVTDLPWLGGMLTSAGVAAPDGNELLPWQTGLWGQFLRELQRRQPGGLDQAWVSFFTYDPAIAAKIFADWVRSLPTLTWKQLGPPLAAEKQGDRLTAVDFAEVRVTARIIVDGTELGDLLALAEVPHRWGWDWRSQWQEPSAPDAPTALTEKYPVQSPTWVVVMQDFGDAIAPAIPTTPLDSGDDFQTAWDGYGAEKFLNYGRLPGNRFMINWPQDGNDYGYNLNRLVESTAARQAYWQEAQWHSQNFARFIQQAIAPRYGLAIDTFPDHSIGGGAFALLPYYRESRRLVGLNTVTELDILPVADGTTAPLPMDHQGQTTAIALGNYANDHHYPGFDFPLAPKSMRWGGRWTGTPFTIPYGSLVPATTNGLLVCEKNSSVSHIANGATRLQPIVMGIGQAAGMAAALCIEQQCQPRDLPVRSLQDALLTDAIAPAAVIPLINLPPHHPDWLTWQRHYLDHPDRYPADGDAPITASAKPVRSPQAETLTGTVRRLNAQQYQLAIEARSDLPSYLGLVTLDPAIDAQLQPIKTGDRLTVSGRINRSGLWCLVEAIG